MKKIRMVCLTMLMAVSAMNVWAGGLLTNTNQSIEFLRNPARDAAIGIDGVYSNPAGVVFLGDGIHVSLNLQNAHQTRTIETGFPLFVNNVNGDGSALHKFEGNADAPVIPSVQVAYNKGKWSYQFNFAVTGGGGKCEFPHGLGSFEQVVGSMTSIAPTINQLYQTLGAVGIPGMSDHKMGSKYGFDSYMRGRQYYYGFTLGAARKITDNLSVYGGLRLLYGTSNYYGYVRDINVEHIKGTESQMVNASEHFTELAATLNQYAGMMEQMGNAEAAKQLAGAATQVNTLGVATQDIELNCDQTGWGLTPIIGVDYKMGKLNLAAKYEFKTRMRLHNRSANSKSAANIDMLKKFADGGNVPEDSPALLTVGAQYEILPSLKVMAGWHHYFDQDTKQWTKQMLDDSNEYLLGAEWDINKIFTVSAGGQRTDYGLKDAGMSDISFNVSSYSFGFGLGVNVTKKIKVNAAYFHTLYEDYDKTEQVAEGVNVTNNFTRTNRVIGLGVNFTL